MAKYPDDLVYTKDHEWVRVDGDRGTVGITDHAGQQLGDVVYVELPAVGTSFQAHSPFGSVESVKAVSELFMPITGDVLEANSVLADKPEVVNTDPYGEGWMIVVSIADRSQIDSLLSAAEYEDYVKEEGGE